MCGSELFVSVGKLVIVSLKDNLTITKVYISVLFFLRLNVAQFLLFLIGQLRRTGKVGERGELTLSKGPQIKIEPRPLQTTQPIWDAPSTGWPMSVCFIVFAIYIIYFCLSFNLQTPWIFLIELRYFWCLLVSALPLFGINILLYLVFIEHFWNCWSFEMFITLRENLMVYHGGR